MEKILGIDTGTNSLGWAIVQRNEEGVYTLLDHGVNIFQEGVKIEKGIESSKAAERTEHRGVRVHYWRRKVRKIRLLTVLSQANLCPPVSSADLRLWRTKKVYPQTEAFMAWQRTDEARKVNPYYYRYLCLTQKLDLSDLSQRYILGRALYHLNQRRGFLSNRKETTKESEGNVKQGILQLSEDMAAAGCTYLGEYFYQLYQKGERIRAHYTDRTDHYLAEFRAICEKQQLDAALVAKLEKAIFFQRPLKSQKQQVGKCTFEPKKARCSTSHPLYEEYRMYAFINNIKVKTPKDDDMRFLTKEEKEVIIPLFMRKSKSNFTFDEIARKIAGGKENYMYAGDRANKPYVFNYHLDTSVSGCPVTAGLRDVFGEHWVNAVCEVYTLANGKSRLDIVNDIWHALFFYDDDEKLQGFAQDRLQLTEEDAKKFSKIKPARAYAALSLKAIKKILPYMRDYGLIYSEAIFLANLCEVIPSYIWNAREMREAVIENVIEVMHEDESGNDGFTIEQRVKAFLKETYQVDDAALKKLYHPSMIEVYPRQRRNDKGIYQLGSPRINSVRNPMAMHSLFRLRKVVNRLLAEGKVDEETVIHIEFARDLNDANRRKAIQVFQRDNEKKREEARKKMVELFAELNLTFQPTDRDVLKYQLWEEQNHKCLYTGKEIGLTDFLGNNPKFDIEHTIPRSVGGDSTKMNLTLCESKFNRETKKTFLPSELANHEDILARIEDWKTKYENLEKAIRKLKGSSAATKEVKDAIIQRRHRLSLERDYWRGKYQRFTMKEVPEGFSRRQGTDISVISRYARLYLRSVFHKVFIVKGIATSDFRKIWGIQEEYEKKERVNHSHHCVDAVTVACIGPYEYAKLAQYYHGLEDHEWYGLEKPHFEKPWPEFVESMKTIQDDLLVSHYTQDNMMKAAKRRIMTPQGKVLAMGDAARGSLHKDMYYGAIERDGEIKYVVRKALNAIDEKDVKNIVDEVVREKVEDAIQKYQGLKKAIEADGIWMNKEKGVRINKVRLFATTVTRPIHMRQQRDASRHEYKQQYHVVNDSNYMVAVYEGINSKGKSEREFEEVKNIDAANFFKASNVSRRLGDTIVPIRSKSGYDLLYKLQKGTIVILYEETPDEVWEMGRACLQRRLYKITRISYSDGRLELVHQQEARELGEVERKDGAYKAGEDFRSRIRVSFNQFKALIEGVDFSMNELGEITRLI